MDCTKCSYKGCRTSDPCSDQSESYLAQYSRTDIQARTQAASQLIDNGRAGSLTRLEEIIEYCALHDDDRVGVAYCYGLEKEAELLRERLVSAGIRPIMVSCTVDGIWESQIDPGKSCETVSCNPLGQANRLNASGVSLTILMGLCLGHDILLQKHLKMDFTTFVVKDRVTGHHPLIGLPGIRSREDRFLKNQTVRLNILTKSELLAMREDSLLSGGLYLLDIRASREADGDDWPGAIRCPLSELPDQVEDLLPDHSKDIVLFGDDRLETGFAVMYLAMKDYPSVKVFQA